MLQLCSDLFGAELVLHMNTIERSVLHWDGVGANARLCAGSDQVLERQRRLGALRALAVVTAGGAAGDGRADVDTSSSASSAAPVGASEAIAPTPPADEAAVVRSLGTAAVVG